LKAFEGFFIYEFLTALQKKDSKKLFEIAEAVEFVKTFTPVKADKWRECILEFKLLLDRQGKTCPIRNLASILNWPESDSDNGFSQLRKICKELNFPLAETSQISYTRKPKILDAKANKARKNR
jgi:hypothetical protein